MLNFVFLGKSNTGLSGAILVKGVDSKLAFEGRDFRGRSTRQKQSQSWTNSARDSQLTFSKRASRLFGLAVSSTCQEMITAIRATHFSELVKST